MRGINDVHAVALFDLLARDVEFVQNFMGGCTNRGFIHEVAARPKPAAQGERLFDEERPKSHHGEIASANEAGRTGSDDDHVAFDQLVKLFIPLARNLAGNVTLSERRWFRSALHLHTSYASVTLSDYR